MSSFFAVFASSGESPHVRKDFTGERLVVGRREGCVVMWDGTPKLMCYVSPVQHCSGVLNSAVILHELFHGECLRDKLSMEDVPGF